MHNKSTAALFGADMWQYTPKFLAFQDMAIAWNNHKILLTNCRKPIGTWQYRAESPCLSWDDFNISASNADHITMQTVSDFVVLDCQYSTLAFGGVASQEVMTIATSMTMLKHDTAPVEEVPRYKLTKFPCMASMVKAANTAYDLDDMQNVSYGHYQSKYIHHVINGILDCNRPLSSRSGDNASPCSAMVSCSGVYTAWVYLSPGSLMYFHHMAMTNVVLVAKEDCKYSASGMYEGFTPLAKHHALNVTVEDADALNAFLICHRGHIDSSRIANIDDLVVPNAKWLQYGRIYVNSLCIPIVVQTSQYTQQGDRAYKIGQEVRVVSDSSDMLVSMNTTLGKSIPGGMMCSSIDIAKYLAQIPAPAKRMTAVTSALLSDHTWSYTVVCMFKENDGAALDYFSSAFAFQSIMRHALVSSTALASVLSKIFCFALRCVRWTDQSHSKQLNLEGQQYTMDYNFENTAPLVEAAAAQLCQVVQAHYAQFPPNIIIHVVEFMAQLKLPDDQANARTQNSMRILFKLSDVEIAQGLTQANRSTSVHNQMQASTVDIARMVKGVATIDEGCHLYLYAAVCMLRCLFNVVLDFHTQTNPNHINAILKAHNNEIDIITALGPSRAYIQQRTV